MLGVNKGWGHSRLVWAIYHLTPGIVEGERDAQTGELEHEDGWTGHQYSKSLPFQQVKHYKLVWDNSLNLSSGYLKALIGYQQNRRQEFEESMDDYELYFKLHTLTYDLRYVTNEFDGWKLSTGIGGMYQKSGNEGEEYLIPDYRLFDFGLYATATKQLGDRWTLNGGVRYDHRHLHGYELMEDDELRFTDFSRHFNGLTGSIGAVLNVSDNLNLKMYLMDVDLGRLFLGTVYDETTKVYKPTILINSQLFGYQDYVLTEILKSLGVNMDGILQAAAYLD